MAKNVKTRKRANRTARNVDPRVARVMNKSVQAYRNTEAGKRLIADASARNKDLGVSSSGRYTYSKAERRAEKEAERKTPEYRKRMAEKRAVKKAKARGMVRSTASDPTKLNSVTSMKTGGNRINTAEGAFVRERTLNEYRAKVKELADRARKAGNVKRAEEIERSGRKKLIELMGKNSATKGAADVYNRMSNEKTAYVGTARAYDYGGNPVYYDTTKYAPTYSQEEIDRELDRQMDKVGNTRIVTNRTANGVNRAGIAKALGGKG